MVAVTLGTDRLAAADTGAESAARRKGFFSRVYDAITHAQMKRAERELARYRYLLPADFDLRHDLWSGRKDG